MPEFVRLVLAAVLGGGMVLAAGWYLERSTPAPGPAISKARQPVGSVAQASAPAAGQALLAAAVDGLQRSQQQLQAQLLALQDQFIAATATQAPVPAPGTALVNAASAVTTLTAERLAATGVAPEDAEALVLRLDELALARMEASYQVRQAAASGDPDLQRAARDARRQVPADITAIREEFGDATYDSYLYASGQPNRVEVASVLRSSTAVGAGVEPGDYLRSLDGQPLYSVRDLTARIRDGSPEQTYALTIERNGETIDVWVPGGPLGVRVTGAVVDPDG